MPSDIVAEFVNNSPIRVVGKSILSIYIDGKQQCQQTFYVANDISNEIILRLDWLTNCHCVIDTSKLLIEFLDGSKAPLLLNDSSIPDPTAVILCDDIEIPGRHEVIRRAKVKGVFLAESIVEPNVSLCNVREFFDMDTWKGICEARPEGLAPKETQQLIMTSSIHSIDEIFAYSILLLLYYAMTLTQQVWQLTHDTNLTTNITTHPTDTESYIHIFFKPEIHCPIYWIRLDGSSNLLDENACLHPSNKLERFLYNFLISSRILRTSVSLQQS